MYNNGTNTQFVNIMSSTNPAKKLRHFIQTKTLPRSGEFLAVHMTLDRGTQIVALTIRLDPWRALFREHVDYVLNLDGWHTNIPRKRLVMCAVTPRFSGEVHRIGLGMEMSPPTRIEVGSKKW